MSEGDMVGRSSGRGSFPDTTLRLLGMALPQRDEG